MRVSGRGGRSSRFYRETPAPLAHGSLSRPAAESFNTGVWRLDAAVGVRDVLAA